MSEFFFIYKFFFRIIIQFNYTIPIYLLIRYYIIFEKERENAIILLHIQKATSLNRMLPFLWPRYSTL